MNATPRYAPADATAEALTLLAAKIDGVETRLTHVIRETVERSRDEVVTQLRGEIREAVDRSRDEVVAQLREEIATSQAATVEQITQYIRRLETMLEQRLPPPAR